MAYCIWSVCSTIQYNIVLSLVQSSAVQQHQHLRVSHTMKNRTIPWLPIVCVISLIKVPCSKYSTYSNNSTVRTPETNARDYISSRDDPHPPPANQLNRTAALRLNHLSVLEAQATPPPSPPSPPAVASLLFGAQCNKQQQQAAPKSNQTNPIQSKSNQSKSIQTKPLASDAFYGTYTLTILQLYYTVLYYTLLYSTLL